MEGFRLVNGYEGEHPYPIPIPCERIDIWGDLWRIDAISQGPGPGSSGKLEVSRPCPDCEPEAGECEHYWHRDGRQRRWSFPSVFFAKIVPDGK